MRTGLQPSDPSNSKLEIKTNGRVRAKPSNRPAKNPMGLIPHPFLQAKAMAIRATEAAAASNERRSLVKRLRLPTTTKRPIR